MAEYTWKRIVLVPVLTALLIVGLATLGLAGVGSVAFVAGAVHATVNGHQLVPSSTLFPGDNIEVTNGVAALAFRGGSRIVMGQNTTASLQPQVQRETTVALERGLLSLYYALEAPSLRVLAAGLSIASTGQFPTLGEVSLCDGTVYVRTREGRLRVEGYGSPLDVAPGKTLILQVGAGDGQVPGTGAPGAQAGPHLSTQTVFQILGLAAAGVSAETAAVAMVRAGDAKDAANSANATAKGVITAANAVVTSSEQATVGSVATGCAINTIAQGLDQISPYTPPPGFTCP